MVVGPPPMLPTSSLSPSVQLRPALLIKPVTHNTDPKREIVCTCQDQCTSDRVNIILTFSSN